MMAVALFQRIFLSVGFLGLAVAIPYALHQLVVVDTAGDAVIRLSGYDSSVASNKVRPQVPLETFSLTAQVWLNLTVSSFLSIIAASNTHNYR